MNDIVGIKKSNFNGLQTVPAGSTFDFVSNGDNYRITYENLIVAFGANAPLKTSASDLTSVPVLNNQGSVNVIRNLSGKSGVKTIINQFNGIDISIDQTFNTDGTTLVDDVNANTKAFRSLLSNTLSISSTVAGQIQIEGDSITRRVIVNQLSDFPPAIAGVITLADNTEYFLGNDVNLGTNRIVTGTNNVIDAAYGISTLTYTGTGNMFTAVDVGLFTLTNVVISCGGQVLEATDVTVNVATIAIQNVIINTCATVATLANIRAIITDRVTVDEVTGSDGFVFLGVIPIVSINRTGIFSTTNTTGMQLGSTVSSTIEFDNYILSAPSGFGVDGLANNGNVSPGNVGAITNCEFAGGVGSLNNIFPFDFRWFFKGNSANLRDTRPVGLIDMNLNVTETVITAINTPTIIGGTFLTIRDEHFLGSTTARITYLGEKPYSTMIDLSAVFYPASGSNKVLRLFIAINGTPVTAREAIVSSSERAGRSCQWQVDLNNGDIVEAYVENRTDTINIIVGAATLRVF